MAEIAIYEITRQIELLNHWLDTMRGPEGYTGPVVHWWQNSFQFTGAGLDWRYEGIISGYLNLYKKTGDAHWLEKAKHAGQDLITGQYPDGNFRHSGFELNPYSGGRPHEAAVDIALLKLAEVTGLEVYLRAAQQNINCYFIQQLWSGGVFHDSLDHSTFVPNKAATLSEALFLLSALTDDEGYAVWYARPTLDCILKHQITGGPLDGAIYQYSSRGKKIEWFFPYYAARCIPALIIGYRWTSDERYLEAARSAGDFIMRWRSPDGGFPQVVYPNGRVNRYPQWIAGAADILRALTLLNGCGGNYDLRLSQARVLSGQLSTGGFRSASGFASQSSQRPPGSLPDFRDVLPVSGWNDKAFRYLTTLLPDGMASSDTPSLAWDAHSEPAEIECTVRGRAACYYEDDERIELRRGTSDSSVLYRWYKGAAWADVCAQPLLWK